MCGKCDDSGKASCTKKPRRYRDVRVHSRVDLSKRETELGSIGSFSQTRLFLYKKIRFALRGPTDVLFLPASLKDTWENIRRATLLAWHDGSRGVIFIKLNESMANNIYPSYTNVN